MKKLLYISPLFLVLITFLIPLGCSTTPLGRKQLKLLPSSQMKKMGNASFADLQKKQKKVERSDKSYKVVDCISTAILQSIGENPKDWELDVFVDDSANAFALPGQNIGVHTGMIDLVQNADQLAAVIGHEIAHVIADHGNERVSQQLATQASLTAAQLYFGKDDKTNAMIIGALGIGAQYGVLLPFSRTHESEADKLGMKYMAQAGFQPIAASNLWKIMGEKNQSPPEFLSTHPNPETRVEKLKKAAPEYQDLYQQNKGVQTCQL